MDFTLDVYRSLLMLLLDAGYRIIPVSESKSGLKPEHNYRQILLRHDVDRKPERSLVTAGIERKLGVRGTYYSRITPESYNVKIIREIESMGHEIGYHYEDLDLAGRKSRTGILKPGGDGEREIATMAYASFTGNLARLRETASVKTICMHGSPMSRYDSRLIWKYFDYGELGITTEPYFDIPLDSMLYLTDTGRRWDGSAVSVRDRVYSRDEAYYKQWVRKPVRGSAMTMTERGQQIQNDYKFRKTGEILASAYAGLLPERVFLTLHPQRWSSGLLPWVAELVSQNLKNSVKYIINKRYIG